MDYTSCNSLLFVILNHLKCFQCPNNCLFFLLISSLSTLRFGPRWAKVPWTFSASQPPLNPSRPCQVSHSHDASLRGVWTITILSRYVWFPLKECTESVSFLPKECTSAFFSFSFLTPWSQFFLHLQFHVPTLFYI